jgi:pimeloyl-[acyl-carrier protein] methyl ester esterase
MLYNRTIGVGEDLVLLHGWGFNSDVFEDLVAQYKTQYRLTVIDLPGHGRSDIVEGDIESWCGEIIKILPNNPILLGWSLGGLLAMNIARKINLSQLILLASSPKFVKTDDWRYGIDGDNFHQFSDALSLNLSKGLKRFVSLQGTNKSQLKSFIKSMDIMPATSMALEQGLGFLLVGDLRQPFKQLKMPIQVILGKQDTLIPIDLQEWYVQQNIQVTILDTGHLPFLHQDFELRII